MTALSDQNHRATRLFGTKPSRVAQQARRTLEASNLFCGHSKYLRIDESGGKLVLNGRLPTYYLKQMLQTLLRDVEGVERIDNQVAVDYPVSE